MRYLYLLLSLTLSSCIRNFYEKNVDIDPPAYERQLVLHEFIGNSDTVLRVEVSRNYGVFESVPDSSWNVKGAMLRFYAGNQFVGQFKPLPDSPWVHVLAVSKNIWQTGQKYELRAEHADFPALRASDVMPAAPVVDSVRLRARAGINSFGEPLKSAEVFLQDPANEKNYYELTVSEVYIYTESTIDPNGNPILDTIDIYSTNIYPEDSENAEAEFGIGRSLLVNDEFFNGQRYKFSFRFLEYNNDVLYKISIRSVSEAYYLFSLSRYLQEDSEGNPLVEPVNVYSNLDKGIGIWAFYSGREFYIR